MRLRATAASRLPYGGFAGLDPASAMARVRNQIEDCTVCSKIVLLFEERCLDKRRSFRNDLPTWRLNERRPDVRAPEPEEIRALLAVAEADDLRVAIFLRVLAATGIRRGEACALRWSDLDLDHGVLTVDKAVVTAKGGVTVKGPKTRASIRSLAFDRRTVAVLSALRTEQQRLATAADDTLHGDAFVFSVAPGGHLPPHPDAMSHTLSRIRDRAGLPDDIHLHSLRHFHATALDPVISEAQKQARLGWSTVHMARHYTDGVVAEDRRAAEHIGAAARLRPVGETTRVRDLVLTEIVSKAPRALRGLGRSRNRLRGALRVRDGP